MAGQRRGPIKGLDPLVYTGGLPNLVVMERRPTPKDFEGYFIGHWWVIPDMDSGPTEEVWVLVSKRYNVATWIRLATTTNAGIETLTGDTGGQVGPSAGNVNIVGGSGITVVGSPGTNTLTIDAAGAGGINTINKIYKTTLGAGTYTAPGNLIQLYVECIGGGSGAFGASEDSSNNMSYGAAGSSGAYCAKLYTAAEIGTSQVYFVGNGGTGGAASFPVGLPGSGESTTFGSGSTLITAGGGTNISGGVTGGANDGGVATGGDININGQSGSQPFIIQYSSPSALNSLVAAVGANSMYGFGGPATLSNAAAANGTGYGSGGGSKAVSFSSGLGSGGSGAQGIIIITEYLG